MLAQLRVPLQQQRACPVTGREDMRLLRRIHGVGKDLAVAIFAAVSKNLPGYVGAPVILQYGVTVFLVENGQQRQGVPFLPDYEQVRGRREMGELKDAAALDKAKFHRAYRAGIAAILQ